MIQRLVALSYTKYRNMFGIVGIEVDEHERVAYVRLAKQWKRDDMNQIPIDMKALHNKVTWNNTLADQLVGQHLIRSIEKALQTGLQIITTQKNLKDPEDIEKIKVMDQTEMTQLTLSLKQDHRIQFPPSNRTKDMEDLIGQVEMFTEHVTEAGTVSYYAPGEELDCLPRALMICLFAARNAMQLVSDTVIIKTGSEQVISAYDSFQKIMDKIPGEEGFGELSEFNLNRKKKGNLLGPKNFNNI